VRRIVFSFAFSRYWSPALLARSLTKSRRTFYARIERRSFRTASVESCHSRIAWPLIPISCKRSLTTYAVTPNTGPISAAPLAALTRRKTRILFTGDGLPMPNRMPSGSLSFAELRFCAHARNSFRAVTERTGWKGFALPNSRCHLTKSCAPTPAWSDGHKPSGVLSL
jgi:hypothetical protein